MRYRVESKKMISTVSSQTIISKKHLTVYIFLLKFGKMNHLFFISVARKPYFPMMKLYFTMN